MLDFTQYRGAETLQVLESLAHEIRSRQVEVQMHVGSAGGHSRQVHISIEPQAARQTDRPLGPRLA